MLRMDFIRSKVDPCLYYRPTPTSGGDFLFVAVFVDDLVISCSCLQQIAMFKRQLEDNYDMKDLGPLEYCLGIKISRDSSGRITLNQSKYIDDVMARFGLQNAHSEPTPMKQGLKLTKAMSPTTPDDIAKCAKFPYREIVGSLMYLMISTRPDIAYAVGQLSMFLNNAGPEHHAAALHLLRYCKGSKDLSITYSPNTSLSVLGYSDADWAACLDTRRSVTAYVFFAAGGPVSWKSKLQPTVALSSTEAEYMALTAAAQEACSLRFLQQEFRVPSDSPVLIYEDNKGAIAMSVNPTLHKTSKHISIKQHFIREAVQNGDVCLEYIPTDAMLADALTKALSKVIFLKLRDKLLGLRV